LAAPVETRRFLGELRAHVVHHFHCEEDGGYMTAVLQCRPQSERTVRQLLAEHSLLLEGLDLFLKEAETAERIDDDFRARSGVWAELLRRHEAVENLLVEDAFNRDIDAED
jgi:hemerythrin-like domain-containing protein